MGKLGKIFSCAAERGHRHAHVTMDEASGGLIFWEGDWYWWYHAGITEAELNHMIEISRKNNAPVPAGISFKFFELAKGN